MRHVAFPKSGDQSKKDDIKRFYPDQRVLSVLIHFDMCGHLTKYRQGSDSGAIPDVSSGATCYKYDTLMNTARS